MEDEAWRSVTVIDDKKGQPHVLQQRVKVYTQGRDEESAGYTKPEMKHRLVPVKDVVNRLGVKPRGFSWISRTLPRYHRSDNLERYRGSRSGRPRPPMPAVAPSVLGEGC